MTLLIIDSNPPTRAAAAEILRAAGFTVLEAETSAAALQISAAEKPSLVIVAVRGEIDSNASFCRQFKSESQNLGAFVLQISPESLISANGTIEGEDTSFAPDALLAEPYNATNLVVTVRTLLKFQQAQEALNQQTALLNLSHEPIFVWEFNDGIAHWNRGCAELYGFSISEALGKISHILLQTIHPLSYEQYRRTLAETGKWAGELRHTTKDGRKVTVESRQMLIEINDRKLVLETNRNVTERKQAEDKLRQSEEQYRAFIQQSSEGIWRFEVSEPISTTLSMDEQIELFYRRGTLAECNDAMARQYGLNSAADLVGINIEDLLVRTDAANYDYLRAFIESGYRLTEAESHERDAHGEDKYFLNNLIGIIENGKLLRAWGTQRDVTARKRAERALRESETRRRLALEAGQMGTWEWNPETGGINTDSRFLKIYGVPPENLDGTDAPFFAVVHAEDAPRFRAALNASLVSRTDFYSEFRINHATGGIRWLSANGRAAYDANGKPVRVVGVTYDITERKRADEVVRESEEQYRIVTETASDAIISVDEESRIVFINRAAERVFGYKIEEMIGQSLTMLMPGGFRPLHLAGFNRYLETGERRLNWDNVEVRGLHRDGHEFPLELSFGESNRNGKHIFIGIARDITERKRAENALQESQMRLKLTTDAAQIGTWQWDLKTNKIFWSAMHQQMWGYAAVDGEIDFEDWRKLLDAEDLQMAENEIAIARRDGSLYDIEYRIFPADGAPMRWIRSIGQVTRDAAGAETQMLGISTDITRRKSNEDEILRLNQQLQQQVGEAELANRAKDEFLAVLSHELRTPLNSMFGWVRMLSSGQLDAEKTRRAIEVIERNIGVQTKLIEDILDVSRIISGKIQIETRSLDFSHLIASVVELTKPTAEAKNVAIVTDFLQDNCTIEGDGERLQQVVGNLLSNAIKFTGAGGTVTIKLECGNNQAELSIADTGVGIEAEFLPRVFDRFRQADSTSKRRHGGLGLGLAIVKHLVELHGGTVAAQSDGENLGSTFTIRIPTQRRKSKAVFMSVGSSSHENYKLDGTSILIVDDDADTLEMMRTMLAAQGANVVAANSGIEALRIIEQQTPDLLISDIGMPEMDGIEFIGKLRKLNRVSSAALPAIALTAYAGVDDRARILKSGFQRYLPKPISFSELLATIKSLIQKAEI